LKQPGLTIDSVIQLSKDQVSCDLAGEAAILNLKAGMYYGVDPVGARIWSLAQKPVLVKEIRDTLLKEYDVEREQCEKDLFSLLDRFRQEGLIGVTHEDSPPVS